MPYVRRPSPRARRRSPEHQSRKWTRSVAAYRATESLATKTGAAAAAADSVCARLDPLDTRHDGLSLALLAALAGDDDGRVIHHRMRRVRLQVQPRGVRIELRQVVVALLQLHALDDYRRMIAEAVLGILRERLCAKPKCENCNRRIGELHLVLLSRVAGRVRRSPSALRPWLHVDENVGGENEHARRGKNLRDAEDGNYGFVAH